MVMLIFIQRTNKHFHFYCIDSHSNRMYFIDARILLTSTYFLVLMYFRDALVLLMHILCRHSHILNHTSFYGDSRILIVRTLWTNSLSNCTYFVEVLC